MGFEQKVRERAYEIWVASGMGEGMSLDHWCAAEEDMKAVMAAPKARAKATASKSAPTKTAGAKSAAKSSRKAANTVN